MTERELKLQGMRECLEWLENHPEVELTAPEINGHVYGNNAKERMGQHARAMGHADKDFIQQWAYLRKRFSGGVRYSVSVSREDVCERVVVGTKTIPAHADYVIPAAPETEVEIIEWRCSSLLDSEPA